MYVWGLFCHDTHSLSLVSAQALDPLLSAGASAEGAAAINLKAPPSSGQQSKDAVADVKLDLWLEAYDAVSQLVVERACGKSLTIRVTTP
jgi:hypothetical protein